MRKDVSRGYRDTRLFKAWEVSQSKISICSSTILITEKLLKGKENVIITKNEDCNLVKY